MKTWTKSVVVLASILYAFTPALAKKNITHFELEFRAQQSVAAAEIVTHRAMREHPIEVRLSDERPEDDASVIGSRTDDDDQLRDLTATNDVLAFVKEVFEDQAQEWGVKVENGAGLVLAGELVAFDVDETNQAVGALYKAVVRISFELKNKSGKVLWSGSETGDASRYGKKFSNENCNEVLSDALLEAWAALLSDSGLHNAWSGK